MKTFLITYTVLGSMEVIFPLEIIVCGTCEEEARSKFLQSGNFYSTTDCRKVVIESIRQIV